MLTLEASRTLAPFYWYRSNGDGTATPHADSRELCALIDADPRGWFCGIEGAIKHGGVLATAFSRKVEPTYDAAHWLATGEHKPAGYITVTTITAEPAGFPAALQRRVDHSDMED